MRIRQRLRAGNIWAARGSGMAVAKRRYAGGVLLLAALVPSIWSPAMAQADDPARTACEALARDIAGPQFARVGWTMVERTVFVSYALNPAGGASEQQRLTCAFRFDAAAGQWTFDREPTAEAANCLRVAGPDVPEQMRALPQMQAALAKCGPLMKAEEVRLARIPVVEQQLRRGGRYPIKQQDTGLKPGR
jgi:hypothetical protein